MKQPIRTILVALSLLALAITALLHAASPAYGPLGLAGVSARDQVSVGSPSASAPSVDELGSTRARAPSGNASAQAHTGPAEPRRAAEYSGVGGPTFSSDPPKPVHIHSCGPVGAGFARCHAVLVRPVGKPVFVGPVPAGYNPPDLQSAYALPSATTGAGQSVAVVDAYDDPSAEADLGVYRSEFGLPACTTANGCFRKVAQDGSTHYPKANGGWAQEISLDLDMVSAICPKCHIVLVEATNARLLNLLAAVDEAVALGANEISNSYGGPELTSETGLDVSFNHPGIAITASSGDGGFGTVYPAASRFVTAVGGTSLSRASNPRGWSETAWSGSGSGCSAFESQPAWQAGNPNVTSVCSRRAVADVSADADPSTGVSVYDSFAFQGTSGWLVFGGTSVGAPIIASAFALAGGVTASSASYPYAHSSSLFDVLSGSNGGCGSLLCNAGVGWDGPTGLGTPDALGAF